MTELPTGLPGESGYFSQPSDTLDPHLFDIRERMLPEVRRFVLDTLIQFMHKMGLDYAHEWLCVWITGSGITYQWSAGRANGDLDVLFGIDITKFYQRNPRWPGLSDAELAAGLNARLRDQLWPKTANTVIDLSGNIWVIDPSSGQKKQQVLSSGTPRENPSPLPPSTSATPLTPSRRTSDEQALNSATSPSTMLSNGVPSVNANQSMPPVSAVDARSYTSATTTSEPSMASQSPNTKGFWNSKIDAVRSADQTTQDSDTAPGRLITTTPRGRSEDYSASHAIKDSGISETPSNQSNVRSGTFVANEQVYSVTFYINPGTGTDIKHIHPYAAYDLTHNRWDVRPPELPSDPSSLHPKEWADWAKRDKDRTDEISKAFVTHMRDLHAAPFNSPGYHSSSAAVTNLIAQANALMDDIHLGRREAFQGESGKGYGDWHNYRWQAAKQSGVIRDLSDMTHAGLDEKEADQIEKYGAPIVDAATALRQAMQVTHRGRYL